MSLVLDYIVYMTYDLHSQWDATNQWSQPGCPSGMCLRSHVNLTETVNALSMITKAGVPSNKIAIGVSSYGRSFAMADGACYGPHCFYTGTPSQSDAVPGPCTGTGGYISNAELDAIMATPGRVQLNYLDASSHSNIMVYDGNQWVAWMGSTAKAARKALYQQLSMGGISDWATDLEEFHENPPAVAESWDSMKYTINLGLDIDTAGARTGNWVTIQCTSAAVTQRDNLTPKERWDGVEAAAAWNDVVYAWQHCPHPENSLNFTDYIAHKLHGPDPADCRYRGNRGCGDRLECSVHEDTGAAAHMVWNSLSVVNEIYSEYVRALYEEASVLGMGLPYFEMTFAPVPPPPDNTWLQILLDLIGMGAVFVAGPFVTTVLSRMASAAVTDGVKDGTFAVIAATVSIAKDVVTEDTAAHWTVGSQAKFGDYMGKVVTEWAKVAEKTLYMLFNGGQDGIDGLAGLIKDGRFISGIPRSLSGNSKREAAGNNVVSISPEDYNAANQSLTDAVARAFYAYSIPAIWTVSGAFPFVIDTGIPCLFLGPIVMHVASDRLTCVGKTWYALGGASGDYQTCDEISGCVDNDFVTLSGMEHLAAGTFGGITTADIITGAVNTYVANANKNGGGLADPADEQIRIQLDNQNVTTPGFIRLPVCNPAMAFAAWSQENGPSTTVPGYPCIGPQLIGFCDTSSFTGDTTAASPLVSDCEQLCRNLQAGAATDRGIWTEPRIGHHSIASHGTCVFGVEGTGSAIDNADYKVGGQDVVDLITDAIRQFTWEGKVGAHGFMDCKGTIKAQSVKWSLYHSG